MRNYAVDGAVDRWSAGRRSHSRPPPITRKIEINCVVERAPPKRLQLAALRLFPGSCKLKPDSGPGHRLHRMAAPSPRIRP